MTDHALTNDCLDGGCPECDDRVPLERCTGDTIECPHTDCPDGWHQGIDLPCDCTPDCAR